MYVKEGVEYDLAFLCQDNPNTSFPDIITNELLASLGIYPVTLGNKPNETYLQKAVYTIVDNVQVWELVDRTSEEINAWIGNLQVEVVTKTQERLDNFARTRNYDGILSLCTYATDANPKFQAEGQYGVDLRSDTWSTLYSILEDVSTGQRSMPANFEEIEPDLPTMEWPT